MTRALVLCVLAGCAGTRTELIVVVDTDYQENEVLSRVIIDTFDERGEEIDHTEVDIGTTEMEVDIPFSFALTPRDAELMRPVWLRVSGFVMGREDVPAVSAAAITTFMPGERRLLSMFLARACHDVVCAREESCDAGACEPAVRDGASLPPAMRDMELMGAEQVGGDPGPLTRASDEGAACAGDVDCNADHVCLDAPEPPVCSQRCTEDVDCNDPLRGCALMIASEGACTTSCELLASTCPEGFRCGLVESGGRNFVHCTAPGTSTGPCAEHRDCANDYVCASGACRQICEWNGTPAACASGGCTGRLAVGLEGAMLGYCE